MQDKRPEDDPALDDDLDMIDDEFVDDLPEEYDPSAETLSGADGEDSYLDEEYGDEDWEDEPGEYEAAAVGAGAQKPKMKGINMTFNTAVIIGAVILGFGVLVWQVISNKPAIMGTFATALQMGGSETSVFTDSTPSAQKDDSEQSSESGLLGAEEQANGDAPPMPAPVSPAETISPEEQAGLPEPEQSPLTPMPAPDAPAELDANGNPVPRTPDQTPPAPDYAIDAQPDGETPNKAEDMLKTAMAAREQQGTTNAFGDDAPTPAAPAESIDAAPEAPAPVVTPPADVVTPDAPPPVLDAAQMQPPAAPAPVAAASPELEKKIDTLLTRLTEMETRINEASQASDTRINSVREEIKNEITALKEDVQKAPSAPAAAAPADNTEVKKQIEDVREEMKTALAQIQQEIKKAPAAAPAPKAEKAQPPAVKTETSPAPAAPKQASAPKQAAPKKSAASGGTWVLKAAKPGKAWVSRPGEANIRGVGIGDTLDGVGRITSITFAGGRWVVKGSAGQIVQ